MTTQLEKINAGIDDKIVELTGAEKTEYIRQREIEHNHYLAIVAQRKAAALAKSALLAKLGITEDEARLLIG